MDHGHVTTLTSGLARRSSERVTGQHRFAIGSVTKTLVATLVLQLVEKHRLRLDDTVEDVLPGVLDTGPQITVEQC